LRISLISLILSKIPIWFSNNILNREVFVSTTTQVLTSETSRNAISNEVVTLTQDSFPIIGTAAAPIIEKVVVGVLDTELFTNIFTKLSEEIYFQLTSPTPRPLEIKIGEILSFIQPFIEDQNPELFENIPTKITLIGPNEIPSLNSFATSLAILGPLSLIGGLVIVGGLWMRITEKRHYFISIGLVIAASGFLVASLIPVVGNILTAKLSSPNGVIIMTELYKTFTATLVDVSLAVMILGLVVAFFAKFIKRDIFKLPQKKTK